MILEIVLVLCCKLTTQTPALLFGAGGHMYVAILFGCDVAAMMSFGEVMRSTVAQAFYTVNVHCHR